MLLLPMTAWCSPGSLQGRMCLQRCKAYAMHPSEEDEEAPGRTVGPESGGIVHRYADGLWQGLRSGSRLTIRSALSQ
jgi:hypothetical protein